MSGTVLIAGASGLVGTACVERFCDDGWDVVALSRRPPEVASGTPFRHRAADLRDPAATRAAVQDLHAVTHVVYAALYEKPGLIPGWTAPDQMATNLAMLRNLLGPLTEVADLAHLTLLQGTKAYGAHVHPMRIPGRERQPRDDHENFYWLQEDHAAQAGRAAGFATTIMRPQLIVGPNHGVAMNLPPVIGAYAAICREEGRPFGFPGGASCVWEAVDTRLVANAIRWAATEPAAAGQTFNLTNGEVFAWPDLWPVLAGTLGVEPGPPEPVALAEFLPAKAEVWDRIVARHGLRPIAMTDLLGESHHYADMAFAHGRTTPPPPALLSTVKIKQAGFTEVRDTEETFAYWLSVLQERRVLPPRV